VRPNQAENASGDEVMLKYTKENVRKDNELLGFKKIV
jgi:hypothetical protein